MINKTCKCGKVIAYNETCCEECAKDKKKDNAYYDAYKRDRWSYEFYHSKQWLRVRKAVMARYNGICVYSLLIDNNVVPADVVHHIIELKEDRTKGLDVNNLIPLCHEVHSRLHTDYNEEERNKLSELLVKWERMYGNNAQTPEGVMKSF